MGEERTEQIEQMWAHKSIRMQDITDTEGQEQLQPAQKRKGDKSKKRTRGKQKVCYDRLVGESIIHAANLLRDVSLCERSVRVHQVHAGIVRVARGVEDAPGVARGRRMVAEVMTVTVGGFIGC